jgi:hypothetical protein
VLNAYTLLFGGFLLLGGRTADRLGQGRRHQRPQRPAQRYQVATSAEASDSLGRPRPPRRGSRSHRIGRAVYTFRPRFTGGRTFGKANAGPYRRLGTEVRPGAGIREKRMETGTRGYALRTTRISQGLRPRHARFASVNAEAARSPSPRSRVVRSDSDLSAWRDNRNQMRKQKCAGVVAGHAPECRVACNNSQGRSPSSTSTPRSRDSR